jgi:hypothetical protein
MGVVASMWQKMPVHDSVADSGKVRLCAASYVGADYETVELSGDQLAPIPYPLGQKDLDDMVARTVVAANPEYLTVHRADYERNMARLRELEFDASKVVDYTALDDGSAMTDTDGEAASNSGDNTSDGVKAHIEKTIDHLVHDRVTDAKQFGDLKKAVEQAGRVTPGSSEAIGRARHHSR